MNETVLTTLAATGFSVAFFHAALPTHWLPFVLVSRVRNWPRAKTLFVVMLAGVGHVCLTTVLGLLIAVLGFQLDEHLGKVFPHLVGGFLALVGLFYFWRQWTGKGICHHHAPGSHHHEGPECGQEPEPHSHWQHELEESPMGEPDKGDWAAIGGLFVMLTFSPCEAFLPVYLSGVRFGWHGFVVLSVILAVATVTGMCVFTGLSLAGLQKLNLRRFERYEAALVGSVFVVLGGLMIVFGDLHPHA